MYPRRQLRPARDRTPMGRRSSANSARGTRARTHPRRARPRPRPRTSVAAETPRPSGSWHAWCPRHRLPRSERVPFLLYIGACRRARGRARGTCSDLRRRHFFSIHRSPAAFAVGVLRKQKKTTVLLSVAVCVGRFTDGSAGCWPERGSIFFLFRGGSRSGHRRSLDDARLQATSTSAAGML